MKAAIIIAVAAVVLIGMFLVSHTAPKAAAHTSEVNAIIASIN